MFVPSHNRTHLRTPHYRPNNDGFIARLLDPIDWLSQTVYTVLILLTFTLAFRIVLLTDLSGREAITSQFSGLVIAAVSATLAWGLIDSLMYIILSVFERGERQRILHNINGARTEEEEIAAIADELDYILEPITSDEKRKALYLDVLEHLRGSKPRPVRLKREDVTGGLGSLIVTILAMLPSLTPLLLLQGNPEWAIRVSNLVSFIVLFICGYAWGRHTGSRPWRTGLFLLLAGLAMVMIAIPLGG